MVFHGKSSGLNFDFPLPLMLQTTKSKQENKPKIRWHFPARLCSVTCEKLLWEIHVTVRFIHEVILVILVFFFKFIITYHPQINYRACHQWKTLEKGMTRIFEMQNFHSYVRIKVPWDKEIKGQKINQSNIIPVQYLWKLYVRKDA